MSVQSEIDRIITAVGNAYSKVSEKGGTVPASQTVANLATAIDSIPAGGGAPSLQSKSVTYTANGTATITPDDGYDGLSSVDVTVDVSGGGGATIPGIVELFTTSGLRYSPKNDSIINIMFSAWPNYFGVYCIGNQEQNIFIGPAVYSNDMARQVEIQGNMVINDANFNDGYVNMNTYSSVNYYFISDVEMTIETQQTL